MRSGQLRDQVIIEQLDAGQDIYGAPAQTWSTFATVWANIRALSGREILAAQAAQSEVNCSILIRYLPGVLAKMRVNLGGRYFNIQSVRDPDGRKRDLLLDCIEGVNLG